MMTKSLDEDESTVDCHLARGINGILVNNTSEDDKQKISSSGTASLSEDERKMPAAVAQIISISADNNISHKSNSNKPKQHQQSDEDWCDRSQSSRSSWDGKKGRRSSFRSLGGASRGAGRGYSPRWRDQEKQLGVAYSDDNVLDQSDVHEYYHDSASQTSQADSLAVHAHDSHDEGYLSHSTFEGYKSEGSAVGEGRLTPNKNNTEDIEMAEMASVASSGPAPTPFERFMHRRAGGKGVEFASHAHNFFFHKNAPSHLQTASPSGSIILNDMGPPPSHQNSLYFAANAACASAGSHASSVRSFDTGGDVSDVLAHVGGDTDCDRSLLGSEACSLHSQVSQEEKSESLAITPQNLLAHDIATADAAAVPESLSNISNAEERLGPVGSAGMKLPLKRFHQQGAKIGEPLEPLDVGSDVHFTNAEDEAEFRRRRDYDDWSNSRSHSRSRSHSSTSSRSEMSRSRSRSRSRSASPEERNSRERRMRWKESSRRSSYDRRFRERSPPEEMMEDAMNMVRVRDGSMDLDRVRSKRAHSRSPSVQHTRRKEDRIL
jgi:hypothetical protein